jgi:hypothetical protein
MKKRINQNFCLPTQTLQPRERVREIFFLAADVEMIELDNKKNLAFFQRLKSF